jgi:plasmid stability protein
MESEIDAMRATEAEAVAYLRNALAQREVAPFIAESAALDRDVSSLEDLAVIAGTLATNAPRA